MPSNGGQRRQIRELSRFRLNVLSPDSSFGLFAMSNGSVGIIWATISVTWLIVTATSGSRPWLIVMATGGLYFRLRWFITKSLFLALPILTLSVNTCLLG